MRAAVLRGLRPYTAYADEVDALILTLLGEQARDQRRMDRLDGLSEDLIATIEALRRRMQDEGERTRTELDAVPYLAGEPFAPFRADEGAVLGYQHNPLTPNGSPRATLVDLLEGPSERVTELLTPYLALLGRHQPVVELGCGRGELLQLAAEHGIAVRGVDLDPDMVARCQARGLAAEQIGAAEYLEALPDASVGAVFCARLIEHLPAHQLGRLFALAGAKLMPGGVLVAETVNPHSLAALRTFWVDPSHRQPIFPELALATAAIAGFAPAYVFAPGYEDFELARRVSARYTLVATAPAATD